MSIIPMRPRQAAPSSITSKAELICVHPIGVPIVWPLVRQFVGSAILRGGNLSSFAALEQSVFDGTATLWVAWDNILSQFIAAAVTQVGQINGVKIGTVMTVGGIGIDRFGPMLAELENHFRDQGCIRSRICGRKGWLRYYRDYNLRAIVMEKRL